MEAVDRLRPDVVLMDIRMPGMDGIEATRRIVAWTVTRVLVLTLFELDRYVFSALPGGASGFLLKHADPAHVIEALKVVAAGDALLAPSVTRRLVDVFAGDPAPPSRRRTSWPA